MRQEEHARGKSARERGDVALNSKRLKATNGRIKSPVANVRKQSRILGAQ